jgi:hypothetical protein
LFDHRSWTKKFPRLPLVDRDAFLVAACGGHSVIHLGAADAPFTRSAFEEGTLLHLRLRAAARSLWGVDSDRASIEFLRTASGVDDIVWSDMSSPSPAPLEPAEVVLCADIIEHVSSAGALLAHCHRMCLPGGALVLSTINAMAIRPAIRSLLGRESVHPDHVAYYSLSTLAALLDRFGFDLRDGAFFNYGTRSRLLGGLLSLCTRIAPSAADGLVVIARRRGDNPGSGPS